MTTGAKAKRVALLASTEDGAFVRSLTRALDQRGLSARRVSESGLKVALRAPDLTVILGDPPDGGISTVESVGADRGPYAVLMTPGALAARLEARRHGLHIIPRQDDDDVAEIAGAVERLIAELASGAAVEPPREHAAVPLDALDWDEDEPETVARRESGAPSARPSGLGRAKSGAPRLPSFRTTLTEGMSAPPHPHGEPSPTYDDVTVQSSEPLKLANLHEAVTRPHMINPAAIDPHELTTRELVSPPPEDEVETLDAPFGYDTIDDRRGTSGLAEALRARRADADTTSPHRPIMAEPTSDPDITAPQRPVLMLRKASDGEEVAPPPPPPNRTALARAKAATASGEVDAVTKPRPAATSASEASSGPTDPDGVPRLDRGAPPPPSLRRTAAFGSISGSMTAAKTGADGNEPAVSAPASGERPAVPRGGGMAHTHAGKDASSSEVGARSAGAETAARMPSASGASSSSAEHGGSSVGTPPASATAEAPSAPAGAAPAATTPSPGGTATTPAGAAPEAMPSSPAGAIAAGAPTPAMTPAASSASTPLAEARPAKPERRRGGVLAVVAVVAVVGVVALVGAGAAAYLMLGSDGAPQLASSDPILEPTLEAGGPATPLPPPPAPAPAPSEQVAPSRPEDSTESATATPDDEPPAEAVREETAASPEPAPEDAPPTSAADVTASELSPDEARDRSDVFVAEGQQHERAGRLVEARRAFEQAAEIHDLNPHAHAGLARVALEAADPRSAVDHADRAATLRRRRPEYQLLLGDARRAAGDTAGARRAYEQALDLDPDNAEARARLGRSGPRPARAPTEETSTPSGGSGRPTPSNEASSASSRGTEPTPSAATPGADPPPAPASADSDAEPQ